MEEKYVVYSKDGCSFCQQAKNFLLIKSKNFDVKNLGNDYTLEEFREKFPQQKTFPMIVHENTDSSVEIGGYDKLREYLK